MENQIVKFLQDLEKLSYQHTQINNKQKSIVLYEDVIQLMSNLKNELETMGFKYFNGKLIKM